MCHISMSNPSEVNDDSETDVGSIPDSKSSLDVNRSNENNSDKSYSSYVYSPSPDSSEDEAKEENKEELDTVNRLYLKKLEEYKASQEESDEEAPNYCRMVHSAPLTLPRSSHVSTLKAIDEHEELDYSGDSLEKQTEDSLCESTEEKEKREVIITPRQREVPPKKMCIRPVTPLIFKESLEEIIGENEDCFPNKVVTIGSKTYIIRNRRKEREKRSICVQVEDEKIIGSDRNEAEDEIKSKSKASLQEINDTMRITNLPHTVEDGTSSNIALEPNIIILDDKSPSSKLCNSPTGDAPLYAEDGVRKLENNEPVRKKVSRLKRNTVGSITHSKSSSSEVSPHSSTNFNVFSVHTSLRVSTSSVSNFSNASSSSHRTPSKEGHEEVVTLQKKVVSEDSRRSKLKEIESQRKDFVDEETCRAILGNFRLGTADTVAYPISFDDLEMRKRPDGGPTFKEKGSELIKTLSSQGGERSERSRSGSNNLGEIKRMTPKLKLLIDTRQEQSLDMEFYDITAGTSRETLVTNNFRTDPEEMRIDNDCICCFCLKLLRLKR